jgi:hypothetical protein
MVLFNATKEAAACQFTAVVASKDKENYERADCTNLEFACSIVKTAIAAVAVLTFAGKKSLHLFNEDKRRR